MLANAQELGRIRCNAELERLLAATFVAAVAERLEGLLGSKCSG